MAHRLSLQLTIALLALTVSLSAHAALQCNDGASPRTFHISAQPSVSDLVAIPDLAEGGAGELALLIAQQAGPEGYREVSVSADGLSTDGVDAELINVDFERGVASFSACTDSGFLVLAVYLNDDDAIAGVPADVLGTNHPVNYTNVTKQGNARIGLEFNRGGAGRALEIITAGLPSQAQVPDVARRVAELVLTENVANVFDFSESQAPVFGFDEALCVVRDQVVVHLADQACEGHLNPAVDVVFAVGPDGELEAASSEGRFTSQANRLYQATVAQPDGVRNIIFASRFEQTAPEALSNDPASPTALSFGVGENTVSGQVDTPRNTRDFFTFTVPEGAELSGVFLKRWSAGDDIGFVHIDEGDTTVIPSQDTITEFLGGAHISTELFGVSDNVLGALAMAAQGGTGFDAPLPAGEYTFNIQQTGPVISRYELMFLIEEGEPEPAPTTTFSVSNSGASAYLIDGQSNPDLTLVRGQTYVFDVNVPGHPFWIKTSPTLGTGDAFDDGVGGNGRSTGEIVFEVPASAPDTLFYICQFHGAMQGRLNIVDP